MSVPPCGNFPEVRANLARLCRRKERRRSAWTRGMPTDWKPGTVTNPESGLPFTEVSAWEFIGQLLEKGHPLEETELQQPEGATGYVMRVALDETKPDLYVKLQMGGSGKVFGRSFHYSYRPEYDTD